MLLQLLSLGGYLYWNYSFLNLVGFLLNIGDLIPALRSYLPYCIDVCKSSPHYTSVLGTKSPVISDGLLLLAFMAAHTLFGRPNAKKTLKLGLYTRPFTIIQNAFFLHMLVKYWRPLYNHIYVWDTTNRPIFMWGAFAAGLLWLVSATFSVDHFDLFGLKDAFNIDFNKRLGIGGTRIAGFTNRGHYSIVRHPIFSGLVVLLFAAPMLTVNHAIFSLAVSAFMWASIRFFQEPDMIAQFGKTYIDYIHEVPAFFPKIFGRDRGIMARSPITKVKEVVPLAEREKLNLKERPEDIGTEGKYENVGRSASPETVQRKSKRW